MKKIILFLLWISFCRIQPANDTNEPNKSTDLADWTVVTYMASRNNLAVNCLNDVDKMHTALKNIAKTKGSFGKVNVIVQFYDCLRNEILRAKISDQPKSLDENLVLEMGINPEHDLVSCAEWIKKNYAAKHYMWILWSHGTGAEDKSGNIDFLSGSWIQVPGIRYDFIDKQVKNALYSKPEKGIKSILYDELKKTWLSTSGLRLSFGSITGILGAIDIAGMDACLMNMCEIGCQFIGQPIKYLVASQNFERPSGWAYDKFIFELLSNASNMDAYSLSHSIVDSYKKFYTRIDDSKFTLSAIDLSTMQELIDYINELVAKIEQCATIDSLSIKEAVITARSRTVCFSNPKYIDLVSFLNELQVEIHKIIHSVESKTTINTIQTQDTTTYSTTLKQLESTLINGITFISSKVVIANACGHKFIKNNSSGAHGISIYYPDTEKSHNSINKSYYETVFASETSWPDFIKKYRKV